MTDYRYSREEISTMIRTTVPAPTLLQVLDWLEEEPEGPTCGWCSSPIEVKPGHRPRRYCEGTSCRNEAYRDRQRMLRDAMPEDRSHQTQTA